MVSRIRALSLTFTVALLGALALPALAGAAKPAVVTLPMAQVGSPGNPAVAIVPFTDAIYQSCSAAPRTIPAGCQRSAASPTPTASASSRSPSGSGSPSSTRSIPTGSDPHNLYALDESSSELAEVRRRSTFVLQRPPAAATTRSPIPQWADKPYGFANFLRAARFVNSLDQRKAALQADQSRRRLRVRHLQGPPLAQTASAACTTCARQKRPARRGAQARASSSRARTSGSRPPTSTRTAAGRYSYWKYPTNAGQSSATGIADRRPTTATLDPTTGDVTNAVDAAARHLPRLGVAARPGARRRSRRATATPSTRSASSPTTYAEALPGQPRHRRPGEDARPVGHARPGRQRGRVDRHDHAAARAARRAARVWRRLHGGVPNATGLPALALRGRPPAAGQHVLRAHLPVARLPDRGDRRPEGQEEGLSSSTSSAAGRTSPIRSMHSPA